MKAIVLGSAAGGGFPQWNCACSCCTAVRLDAPGWAPRTQDSVAVFAHENAPRAALVNASPDVLAQVKATPALWPRGPRSSPLGAVLLTNGDLDHVLGLFSLRESWPLAVYATRAVWRGLETSAFLDTLRRFEGQLVVRDLVLGEETDLTDARGEPLGLTARAFSLPGKLPIHLERRSSPSPEDNVGLALRERDGAARLAYAAACARIDHELRDALSGHDAVLFDGTFWREDELPAQKLGSGTAASMAHVPLTGAEGSLARLSDLRGRLTKARRIYTHVNNTNPILGPTEERGVVERAGWEIAFDGMELDL